MFLLTSLAILGFTFGFVFPPLWILTALAVHGIIRAGQLAHDARLDAEDLGRAKTYLSWSKSK